VAHQQSSSTLRRGHFVRGTWRPLSLVEKLLSGGGIKVTKRAWKVLKWLAFVVSQVVLLVTGKHCVSASTTWTRGGLVPTDTTG
jgi:hypothetical protein